MHGTASGTGDAVVNETETIPVLKKLTYSLNGGEKKGENAHALIL